MPHPGVRYTKTAFGILSYKELAPRIAERVADTELKIANRELESLPILDLLLELHRRVLVDLMPEMAGRWRLQDVRVGEHHAPPYWQVPMLMHSYAADLEARTTSADSGYGDRILENLAFAEGRLLFVHPFEDFNGRVSRLFLAELLYRLDLPVIDPAASSREEAKRNFAALQAYDLHDPRPLMAVGDIAFCNGSLNDAVSPMRRRHILAARGRRNAFGTVHAAVERSGHAVSELEMRPLGLTTNLNQKDFNGVCPKDYHAGAFGVSCHNVWGFSVRRQFPHRLGLEFNKILIFRCFPHSQHSGTLIAWPFRRLCTEPLPGAFRDSSGASLC